jgi:hypothetical protein
MLLMFFGPPFLGLVQRSTLSHEQALQRRIPGAPTPPKKKTFDISPPRSVEGTAPVPFNQKRLFKIEGVLRCLMHSLNLNGLNQHQPA